MASIENLAEQLNPNRLGDTDYMFYDADTLYDSKGQGYRLRGVNAPEVDTLGKEGMVGGDLTTDQVVQLANDLGFTNLVNLGEVDATGTRTMADLVNEEGRSFSEALASSGLLSPVGKYDEGAALTEAYLYREAMKSNDNYAIDEFDLAKEQLDKDIGENVLGYKVKRTLPGQESKYFTDEGALFEFDNIDTDTGMAKGQLGASWDIAMEGVKDGLYGTLEMIGEKTGVDYLEQEGTAGSYRAQARIGDEGNILTDYEDINGFGDAAQYLGNLATMSIPYMAISAGAIAAAPITSGASLLAPVSIYTGQVWNEMGDQIKEEEGGERSAAYAIGAGAIQGALDMFGLKIIGLAAKSKVGTKKLFEEATKKVMDSQGMTEQQAVNFLSSSTKAQFVDLLKDSALVVEEQLAAKKITLDALKRAGIGATGEGVTEAAQESIAAIAADLGSDQFIDWKDVQDRAIQGFVAGGALGGAFSTAGAAWDAGQWANAIYSLDRENPNHVAEQTEWAREDVRTVNEVDRETGEILGTREVAPTIDDFAEEARKAETPFNSLESRSQQYESSKKEKSFKDTTIDVLTSGHRLWKGATRYIFNHELLRKSKAARKLASMFDGSLQKVYGGSHFENFKHHMMTRYKNTLRYTANDYFIKLNEGNHVFNGAEMEISDEFYSQVEKATNGFTTDFDPSKLTIEVTFKDRFGKDKTVPPLKQSKVETVKQLVEDLEKLSNNMYDDQSKYNPELGKLNNYLLRYKTLNKKAVYKNKHRFIKEIMKVELPSGGYLSEEEATRLTEEIINGHSGTLEEAYDVTKGEFSPGSHKKRTFNLAEREEFSEFMEHDLFSNVSQAAKSAARYMATQKYVGTNGEIIAHYLDQMEAEGVPKEEVDKIAHQMRNYLAAESGNYKRATSDTGKALEAIQKNFMLFVTITSLPLATVSSLVEVMLTTRGLTKDQIFGTKERPGLLNKLGKELASTLYSGMLEVGRLPRSAVPAGVKFKGGLDTRDTPGSSLLQQAGYYEWEVGAASVTGVTETHDWHNRLLTKYFKWTGLQGWTNFTRAVRASFAGDYISDNLSIILDSKYEGTNAKRESEEKLRNLGIPVTKEFLLELQQSLYDTRNDKGEFRLEEILRMEGPESRVAPIIREAVFNFTNEAVAMPQSANRPLMYQDPRMALFMQFQGFMATFTANHIPRLWGEYVKRGSPAMKYQTFSMVVGMVMMGFASQYLKDLIKFGESSPYLDEAEFIQRGLLATGLMGTPERVFNQFFPIYEQRTDGPGEWLFNTTVGESPALGKVELLAGAGADAISGDTPGAGKDIARATLGPFYHPLKWTFE